MLGPIVQKIAILTWASWLGLHDRHRAFDWILYVSFSNCQGFPVLFTGRVGSMLKGFCELIGNVGDSAGLAVSILLKCPRTVFIFHSIANSSVSQCDTHRPEVFLDFLNWIRARSIVTDAGIIAEHEASARMMPLAALTFDDGFLDHYTTVFPLLLQYRLTGTFFVPTGFVGTRGMLTRSMLREMSDHGMLIGSHSVSHCRLSDCDAATLRRELTESKFYLEDLTGRACDLMAYPFGYHSDLVTSMTEAVGYRTAFGSTPSTPLSNRFALPRIGIPNQCRTRNYIAALHDAGKWRRSLRRYEWLDHFIHSTLSYNPERLERPRSLR